MEEIRKELYDVFLFGGAKQAVDETKFNEPERFSKGQVIYGQDSYPNGIGILLSGKAKALSLSGGGLLTRFEKGSVFGAAGLFGDNKEYISKIVADSDCAVLFIDQTLLEELFEKYPKVSLNYISFLSSKIRFLNEKLAIMMQDGVEGRLYEFLLKNDGYSGKMTVLSNMLCIGRTSLYRALLTLEEKNLIVRNDERIKVII